MKISYLVTCHNETETFEALLRKLDPCINSVGNSDEIIILDDFSTNPKTRYILDNVIGKEDNFDPSLLGIKIIPHALNNDYGAHKNFGIEQCAGDYIFQIDGDELPPDSLIGENLHALLKSNPSVEAYSVPRINDFKGVTPVHAKQWGWRLTESPMYKRSIVNWPDPQWRIFKRDYPRISFTRRLHEKIEGYSSFVHLPADEEYALYHDKTIEKQIETNLRYNQQFTIAENQGHAG